MAFGRVDGRCVWVSKPPSASVRTQSVRDAFAVGPAVTSSIVLPPSAPSTSTSSLLRAFFPPPVKRSGSPETPRLLVSPALISPAPLSTATTSTQWIRTRNVILSVLRGSDDLANYTCVAVGACGGIRKIRRR